jgi:hypothetical protein
MKTLVIALAILLLFPSAVDAGKKRNRVYVNDYTNSSVVAETVDDFNRIMPKRGPRLIYRSIPGLCSRAITVCQRDLMRMSCAMSLCTFLRESQMRMTPIPTRVFMED